MSESGDALELELLRVRVQSLAMQNRHLALRVQELAGALQAIAEEVNPALYHELTSCLAETEDGDGDVGELLTRLVDDLKALTAPPLRVDGGDGRSVRSVDTSGAGADDDAAPPAPTPSGEGRASVRSMDTGKAGDSTAADASAGTSASSAEPGDEELSVLRLIGETGEFLATKLVEMAAGLPWARNLAESSRATYLYSILSRLEELGWLETESIDLKLSNRARKGLSRRAVRLTEAGKQEYRKRFGDDPVDLYTPFVGKYKTVEAGLFIRLVRDLILAWNEVPESTWRYEVIDAVWEPDEAFARIPGAKRSYPAPDGSTYALPDLIVMMIPRVGGGTPPVAVVEVELGGYKLDALREKWQRALLCYPPMPLYVVAPNNKVRGHLFGEYRRVVERVKVTHGLPHGARGIFYTPDEIMDSGLLSPRQLTSLTYRLKQDPESVEVKLPKFWFENKQKRKEEVEQGELGLA